MPASLRRPAADIDPTPIFEAYRGNYSTELLVAAVAHLRLFEHLAAGPLAFDELRSRLGLSPRAANVLVMALRAMNFLTRDADGRLSLPPIAREHLLPGGDLYVGDYLGLAAQSPGVREMVDRLRSDRPANSDAGSGGAAFIYRDGIESAMERESCARDLTLALAGRAKNVAPVLAERLDLSTAKTLLDVGGGTGLYSIACLQRYPHLHATVFDRAEVLKVAKEMADRYGVSNRLHLSPGDMFRDPLPPADVGLLSNILHDWDEPQCQQLVNRCAAALHPGGTLVIHDVLLDDDLGGPLPIALYSAALFSVTEGRAYAATEYRTWTRHAGLRDGDLLPTAIHCTALLAHKP